MQEIHGHIIATLKRHLNERTYGEAGRLGDQPHPSSAKNGQGDRKK